MLSVGWDPRDEVLLLWLEAIEERDDLTEFGMPSHFEFTLGAVVGSFCGETPWKPIGLEEPPLAACCLRWDSANCSKASWDGSFRERKLSTPLFFFFDDALDSREVEPLDARLVAAEDVVLLESLSRAEKVDGWWSAARSVSLASVDVV